MTTRIKKTDLFDALYTLNESADYDARRHCDGSISWTGQGYYVLCSGRSWSLWLGIDRIEYVLATYVCGSQGLREMLTTVQTVTRHVKALKLARLGADIDQIKSDVYESAGTTIRFEDKMLIEDRF